MPNLNWYAKRLQAMSVDEIIQRTQMEARKFNWRRQLKQGSHQPTYKMDWSKRELHPINLDIASDTLETQRLLEEADAYMRHEWFYGGEENLHEDVIDWHKDPASGIVAPLEFGFDVNHRDETLVGNIKITWEKSRHHHLTVLAVAYALTNDEKYSQEVVDQILDWIEANPYLLGVNWTHPLEQAIRLIAWIWCDRLLHGSIHHERLFRESSPIWSSIYQHQLFIEETYSKGSSANNHLIGEMAGLFTASVAWPIFERSDHWMKFSQAFLEKEIVSQTFPSGINRELAFSYHIFALEFFLLSLVEANLAGISFSSTYMTYMKNMLEVIPELTDSGGNMPRFGDGDEGMALQLQHREERRDAWLLHVGHSLCSADVPGYDAGYLATHALGFEIASANNWQAKETSIAYEDAGLYLLTQNRNQANEIFLLADAGPHGYLSIAAHAHADALSFVLSVGGQPILVDVGTYAYHTDEYWRQYFKSTPAHNTVTVDHIDQSTQGGSFMWTQQAETTVTQWKTNANGGLLEASHNGYKDSSVTHIRTIELENAVIKVTDQLDGINQHHVSVNFHLSPDCEVNHLQSNTIEIVCQDKKLELTLPDFLNVSIEKATEKAGWYSPAFGVKEPTNTIIAQANNQQLPISCITTIKVVTNNDKS